MDDRYNLIRDYGLYRLPANGSSAEYARLINGRLTTLYPHCKPLTKRFVARALRKLGFLHVGRDRKGDNLLYNPHHGKGPVI